MNYRNYPDYILIRGINRITDWLGADIDIIEELQSRTPDEVAYYFGIKDDQGNPIFLPIIQDWDEEQARISYLESEDGNEVWL